MASIVVVMEQPPLERAHRFAGDQRLAAQDAVLVGERQADDFEVRLLDEAAEALCGLLLLIRPQAVTLDETHRITPLFLPRLALRGAGTSKARPERVGVRNSLRRFDLSIDLYPLTRIADAIRPLPASGAR
ncbi:hypothetical protein ABIA28_008655 [Bradyrhizobium elkanii]